MPRRTKITVVCKVPSCSFTAEVDDNDRGECPTHMGALVTPENKASASIARRN